jgi:hypothetical protein
MNLAEELRNPFHLPGLKVAIDADLQAPLASLLEVEADVVAARTAMDGTEDYALDCGSTHLLDIARLINGTTP